MTAPLFNQRRTVLVAAFSLISLLVLALSGPSWVLLIGRLIVDGPLLLAWLVAAAGWGSLLPLPRDDSGQQGHSLGKVTAVSAGVGMLGLLQLACGLAGFLHRGVGVTLITIGVALAAYRFRRLTRRDVAAWFSAPAGAEWLLLAAAPVLAMTVVAAYVPPGVLWGDEPHGYDVLEYHLQLPREWYELGRITPLAHNVFSYFPLGVEMHYLLAMQLAGGPWEGMYLAQLMHVAFVSLSVLAVYGVARQFAGRLPATIAAIAAAYVPWMMLLAPVAYNEGGLLLFGTLAVGWTMRALIPEGLKIDDCGVNRSTNANQDKPLKGQSSIVNPLHAEVAQVASAGRRNQLSPWLIAGVFAGFTCGAKLTAVPLLLLIVPVLAGIVAILHGRCVRRVVVGAATFVVAGTVVFSPWLIRNFAWTRNPVFPEAQSIFGRAHFSEVQSKRWARAHAPAEEQRSVAARLSAARAQILRDWRYGWVLLPLGLVAAAVRLRSSAEARLLVALLAAWLVFWLGFTHLQGRFYVLAIPVAALAIALLRPGPPIYAAGLLVLIQVIVGLTLMGGQFAERVAEVRDNQVLGFDNFRLFLPPDVQHLLDQPEPIALAGDAKAFLYRIPMARLRYRTVFDVNAAVGESVVSAWVGDAGATSYVVVDPLELKRFAATYYGIPRAGDLVAQQRASTFILPPTAPPH